MLTHSQKFKRYIGRNSRDTQRKHKRSRGLYQIETSWTVTMSDRNVTNKEDHEQFVSGHSGTSVLEISVLVSMAPVTLHLRDIILFKISHEASSKTWIRFAVDFCMLVMTLICGLTVLANQIPTLLILYMLSFIAILLHRFTSSHQLISLHAWKELKTVQLPTRLPFITHFRAYVNLATSICILAVDFTVFPRRFCKAETYGTGIMDVGVGAFVMANAIVSPEARGKSSLARSNSEVMRRLAMAVFSSVPLWVLGFCRLLAVKGIDYHEHVSEYGVHWNFFFTLAVVRVMSTLIFSFVSHQKAWLMALAIAGIYETWLQLGLKDDLILGADGSGSRMGLLDANREGIFSCFGYLAIYFAGVQLGQYLLKPRSCFKSWFLSLLMLSLMDAALWVLLAISQATIDPVSRRMANLSYILWMMAYNIQVLAEFLVVDLANFLCTEFGFFESQRPADDKDTSRIATPFHLLEAISRNGLFFFLLANVLTGAVNILVSTIDASVAMAVLIICVYMLVLSAVTALLHLYNITIKFW